MTVCGLSGTPRVRGNSEILLNHALSSFKEVGWATKIFRLSEFSVLPCTGCDLCDESGRCVINDDMDRIYDAFRECRALVISTPVYYRTMSAQLLSVLQRIYAVRREKPLAGKVGGAIAVGRGSSGGQSIAINQIYTWMLSCGMVCLPGELNGVTAVADNPGEILDQPNRLRQAEMLGENMLSIAQKLNVDL